MPKSISLISLLALVVSPAHAAPAEIGACGRISQSGSYVLTQNISAPSGFPCLVIDANEVESVPTALPGQVTIDLAGFTITGTGAASPVSVGITRANGNFAYITVRNGTIIGFHSGVDLSGGGGGDVVEGLRVTTSFGPDQDVNAGIGIRADGIVRNNQVFGGGRAGGINASGRVTGNYASSVNGTTMSVLSADSTVIGNTVFGGAQGLVVTCPSNVTDNTSTGSPQNLVLSGQGCNNTNNVAPP
jgi:hypothetical protein